MDKLGLNINNEGEKICSLLFTDDIVQHNSNTNSNVWKWNMKRIQNYIDEIVKTIIRVRKNSSRFIYLNELKIKSKYFKSSKARAKIYFKSEYMNSYLRSIMKLKSNKKTWIQLTNHD